VIQTLHAISAGSVKVAEITAVIEASAFSDQHSRAQCSGRPRELAIGVAALPWPPGKCTPSQRSASAAKEVKGLITHSVDRGKAGSVLVEAGTTIGGVILAVKRVSDLLGEIIAAPSDNMPASSRSILPLRRWTR
jgi:hypothetical protein